MPTNPPIDVSGLKGLHIPTTPNMFPLAMGWWLVIIAVFLLILCLYFTIYAFTHSLRRQVSRQVEKIKKISDNKEMLKSINQLAKQVAIHRFGREKVASLHEENWVTFMNNAAKKHIFSKEYVDLLRKNIYAGRNDMSDSKRQRILQDYEEWIRIILKK